MTELIITEKRSVAVDLATALGGFNAHDGYFEKPGVLIAPAQGHLVKIGVDPNEDPGFVLEKLPLIPDAFSVFPIDKRSMTLLNVIDKLARRPDVNKVVNACDAGREGELIFRLIVAYLGIKKPVERLWFQTMTPVGLKTAFAKRRSDAEMRSLADAARSRSEADFLIGINATRALTKSNLFAGEGQLVTAGRVQTSVLALVVDREDAIRNFQPRNFWEVFGTFKVAAGSWVGKLARKKAADNNEAADRFFDKEEAQRILNECSGPGPYEVRDSSAPMQKKPPTLFDLTQLQRTVNSELGFSAQKTLDIAQALYDEHKVTTYPRTDSSHLPEDYPETVKKVLGMLPSEYQGFCKEVLDGNWVSVKHPVFNNKKISDHFAIIPTGKISPNLKKDEAAVYDIIVRRFIAAFFPAAEFTKTTREVLVGAHTFRAVGIVQRSEGWLKIYPGTKKDSKGKGESDGDDGIVLPLIADSERAMLDKSELKTGKTKAPPRYNDNTLLGAMENAGKMVEESEFSEAMKGLGTPATRASMIEELLSENKGYMIRVNKFFQPTPKADNLIHKLREFGLEFLTSATTTGEWEYRLGLVEKGEVKRAQFMDEIKKTTRVLVETIKSHCGK